MDCACSWLLFCGVPAGSPSRGEDVAVCVFDINQPSLPTPFLFCFCVYFCFYGPFNCISFHKLSLQLCFISALLVLSTVSFFMKVSFSPDIILCGWLGLKHQLTDCFMEVCASVHLFTSCDMMQWGVSHRCRLTHVYLNADTDTLFTYHYDTSCKLMCCLTHLCTCYDADSSVWWGNHTCIPLVMLKMHCSNSGTDTIVHLLWCRSNVLGKYTYVTVMMYILKTVMNFVRGIDTPVYLLYCWTWRQ